MYKTSDYQEQISAIEQTGIVVMHNISLFSAYNTDIVCPYLTLLLTKRGYSRSLYDLHESVQRENDFSCVLPGHVIRPLESSKDCLITIVVVSQRLFKEMQFHTFSHDFSKFDTSPFCTLTPEQAQRMTAITEQLENIASHPEEELPHRHEMMLAMLAVGYEYINMYRREQDRKWASTRQAILLNRFCDLVVEHYRESREVGFYAMKMNLTAKYLSKIISTLTKGQSPSEWIEQYVIAQAKYLLLAQQMTVKEIAFYLGFNESSSFCRFFKRATGYSPQEYRRTHQSAQ